MSPQSHYRGLVGAYSRHRDPKDPELVAAQQNLAESKITDYIAEVLANAPPLREEQRSQLAQLLAPVRETA